MKFEQSVEGQKVVGSEDRRQTIEGIRRSF